MMLVGLGFGLALGAAVYLAADWLAAVVFHKPGLAVAFRYLGPSIPLVASLRILASSTTVTRRLHYMVVAEEIAQPVLQLACFVVLWAALVPGLDAAMVAVLASVLLAAGLAGGYVQRLFGQGAPVPGAEIESLATMLSFSVPVAAGGFLGSFLLWADRLLIGALGTENETGVYAVASLVSVVFVTLLSGFKSSFAPLAASLHASGDRPRLTEAFRLSTRWSQYLAIPLFLFLAFSGRDLLAFALGPAYQSAYAPMLILSIGQLVNAVTGPADTLLIMGGHPRRWAALASIGLMGLVVLSIWWIPRWGLLGAALASAATVITVSLGGLGAIYLWMRITPFDARTPRVFAAALLTLLALLVVGRLAIPWWTVRQILNGLISAGLFFGLLLLGGLPPEEAAGLRHLRARLFAKGSRSRPA